MKSITKFETEITNGKQPSNKLALLAYLQYHYDNPGLHPDDVYTAGGGYEGIGPVIVYIANLQQIPAYVEYPSELLQLSYAIEQLQPQTEIENQHIELITDFLDTFDEELLSDVIYNLSELSKLDETDILERVKEILVYIEKGL